MLVEQRTLAHHLDRSGAARVEHQAEAALQQFADPDICQKSFFLAAGKAKELVLLAEPPGDLRMLTKKEIAARRHYAGPDQADPEGAAREGHQALLCALSSSTVGTPRSSSSDRFKSFNSMSSLSSSASRRFPAYSVKAPLSRSMISPVSFSRFVSAPGLLSRAR